METENRTPNPYYDRPSGNSDNINSNISNQMPDDNGPFYSRPGQSSNSFKTMKEPIVPPNSFARASMVLAGIALVSVFTFTIFPAIILGSLALILALLSRGAELKMHPSAKTATLLVTIALIADITIVGGSFGMIFGDNSTHDMLNETYEEIYGMTYDEILEGIMDGSIDYEDLYEQMYENLDEMHY